MFDGPCPLPGEVHYNERAIDVGNLEDKVGEAAPGPRQSQVTTAFKVSYNWFGPNALLNLQAL